MQPGDTFFLSSAEDSKPHLYTILSRPNAEGKVLCVNFSTYRGTWCDSACVIQEGRYRFEFVKVETYINYQKAKAIDLRTIENNVNGRMWPRGEVVPTELLLRIQDGARKSRRLEGKLKPFLGLF